MMFKRFTGRQLAQRESPKWLIERILPARGVITLVGQEGTFKSYLALDMALSVASGESWHGYRVAQGKVLYIAAEADYVFGDRYVAWITARGTGDVADCEFIPRLMNLRENDDAQRLKDTVMEMAKQSAMPALIVIDTLSQTFGGGEENSSADMMQFVMHVQEVIEITKGAALVIHHTGNKKRRSRGHSSLPGAVSGEIHVIRDDPKRTKVKLENSKTRGVKKFADLEFVGREIVVSSDPADDPPLVFELVGEGADHDVALSLVHDEKRDNALRFAALVHVMGNPLASEVEQVQGMSRDAVNRYAKGVAEGYGFIEINKERVGRSDCNRFTCRLEEQQLAKGLEQLRGTDTGQGWLSRHRSMAENHRLKSAA